MLIPRRLGWGLCSLALLTLGVAWPDNPPNNVLPGLGMFTLGIYSLGLIVIGTALLVASLILPALKEVEFGFPAGSTVTSAVRRREESLRREFDRQRSDLELCAQLLCDDPAVARDLVEASWATATALWRGPVNEHLRTYAICTLVDLVSADQRWNARAIKPEVEGGTPLCALDPDERTAVVLHDFAGLPSNQISTITHRPIDLVRADLLSGTLKAEAGRAS